MKSTAPMLRKLVGAAALVAIAQGSSAATFKINDESSVDFGARMQALALYTDSDVISDRDELDFKIRRARLRANFHLNSWVSGFVQTGYSEEPGSGSSDMRILDAYIHLKPSDALQIYFGQNLVPSTRQTVTSAGALMAIDRPGVIYKAPSWGTKAAARFANLSMGNTDPGLDSDVDVRDIGMTFWGTQDISDSVHSKYYFGIYEGADSAASERIAGRFQLNFGDAEAGYFNKSTYMGSKQIFSLGLSVDQQSSVAKELDTGEDVDLLFYNLDMFLEQPMGAGALSLEAAYISLDLDDAGVLTYQDALTTLSSTPALQAQGSGYYIQSGYSVGKWQPWVVYESWESDAENGAGSYSASRVGATYFIEGHKANLKFGIEQLEADQAFSTSAGSDDSITSVVFGIFFDL